MSVVKPNILLAGSTWRNLKKKKTPHLTTSIYGYQFCAKHPSWDILFNSQKLSLRLLLSYALCFWGPLTYEWLSLTHLLSIVFVPKSARTVQRPWVGHSLESLLAHPFFSSSVEDKIELKIEEVILSIYSMLMYYLLQVSLTKMLTLGFPGL